MRACVRAWVYASVCACVCVCVCVCGGGGGREGFLRVNAYMCLSVCDDTIVHLSFITMTAIPFKKNAILIISKTISFYFIMMSEL